jgi:radical SAM/Cys-rich protein
LSTELIKENVMNAFETRIQQECGHGLYATEFRILQVNLGFKCNLSCTHCYLECGPDRTEMMNWEIMSHIVRWANENQPVMVDITGGSPELHPDFKKFVSALRKDGHTVQVRTNLTVLHESNLANLPDFFKKNNINLVASLPCYLEENVCKQRGMGVYEESIQMLQKLNSIGFGILPNLPLRLVYNPGGPFLPPSQAQLEEEYKRELNDRFGIQFTSLYTITNMPIGRFWERLKLEKKDRDYMQKLQNSFNCQTVHKLMCRHQVSVAWDGTLYDCDFNIAIREPLSAEFPRDIREFEPSRLINRRIATGKHCFGCTAGMGSSCGGALAASSS